MTNTGKEKDSDFQSYIYNIQNDQFLTKNYETCKVDHTQEKTKQPLETVPEEAKMLDF